ncbi:MAG: DNA-binding transcriptional LysR family regulator [Bacteriovoracaceae bacterium]|jgi:DNA-binding transcriptional LysR family regulator
MHINTDTLEAFLQVHQEGSFTKAAGKLGISQSALSQKMARLETLLHATLFIRGTGELNLTNSGEKLLLFAKQQLTFEKDFIHQFNQYQAEPAGIIRVAGFSSITRSVLIPALSGIIRKYPNCQIEFSSHEVVELEDILKKNKADIVITDYKVTLPGTETIVIGEEEYVVIESKKEKNIPLIYLDHGPHDNATESFFKFQNKKLEYRRGFMGDVYGIIEGVELGLGRAVMSRHLVKSLKNIQTKKHAKKYFRDIHMSYFSQHYYSPLHQLVVDSLKAKASNFLS